MYVAGPQFFLGIKCLPDNFLSCSWSFAERLLLGPLVGVGRGSSLVSIVELLLSLASSLGYINEAEENQELSILHVPGSLTSLPPLYLSYF